MTIGADGKITDVNSATEAVTGYARDRLIGTEFSDYFSDPDKARAGYRQVFSEGKVRDYELEIRHQDGHLTPVLYNAALYRNDAAKPIGVFAAARDISERKHAEEAVNRLNIELEQGVARRTAELEAANKELEDFSYSISHDLRTPLRAIAGFARIVVDEHAATLDSEGRRLLDVVQVNTVRMGRLIDELLEFLRLGRQPMNFGPVDVAQLVLEIFGELQTSVPDRKLQLVLKDPPPLWGDRTMIRRLLTNLLSNAEILLVEDTAADAELTIRALKKSCLVNNLVWVKDGAEALDFIFASGAYAERDQAHQPKVVLLDLRLPRVSGIDVLRRLKNDARTRTIPVVVLTSSKEDVDIDECYRLGVNSYIAKPVSFDEFVKVVGELGLYWLLLNKIPNA